MIGIKTCIEGGTVGINVVIQTNRLKEHAPNERSDTGGEMIA